MSIWLSGVRILDRARSAEEALLTRIDPMVSLFGVPSILVIVVAIGALLAFLAFGYLLLFGS
jgi:hypothetical protein